MSNQGLTDQDLLAFLLRVVLGMALGVANLDLPCLLEAGLLEFITCFFWLIEHDGRLAA